MGCCHASAPAGGAVPASRAQQYVAGEVPQEPQRGRAAAHQGEFDEEEARIALKERVTMRMGEAGAKPITDVLDLEFAQQTAFTSKEPLSTEALVEYHGPADEDVLLKLYTLDGSRPVTDYGSYELAGYIHATQRTRPPVPVKAGCFLGIALHRNLNTAWCLGSVPQGLWQMRDEDPEKYQRYVSRSDEGGYAARGDVDATREAREADYLISFTAGNKEENDELLKWLASTPVQGPHGDTPMTFCTDRSLGLGGHFDPLLGVYLGKTGFGQPTEAGGWFRLYLQAALETKVGVLLLNFTREYLRSQACRMELGRVPRSRLCILVQQQQRVVRWEELARDRALLVAALQAGAEASPGTAESGAHELLRGLAGFATEEAKDAHTALPFLELELSLAEEREPEDIGVAAALQELAVAHLDVGDPWRARELHERGLAILERHFGPDHFQVAITLHALSNAHGHLGEPWRQRELLERALPILERHFGPDHFRVARALHGLANAHGHLDEPRRQRELLERALPILKRHFGPDHFRVARALHDLANAHGDLGEPRRKRELLERALRIEERHFGPDHFEVAITLHALANAHGDLGEPRRKRELLERALPILERHFGPDHFQVARALFNLARAHAELGDLGEAEALAERWRRIESALACVRARRAA